ncbi:MAG: carboxypeptidase-like regulatory domain-containing protein [Terriglobales bacterium]
MKILCRKMVVAAASLALLTLCMVGVPLAAQTLTTGAITGQVTDPQGALVPGANITALNTATGSVRTGTTGANGSFSLSQLDPGDYQVKAAATGFGSQTQTLHVSVSQTANANFALKLGASTETVEVQGTAPLLQTDNPNTTTTISSFSIANTPNPGGDLSYVAQVAPGANMNTSGGYGNVEFNGLPALSNNFTIDGLDANDPFLNLNNSGATNLQLGLNAIDEVTVNTTSYSVDQGRQGASQINYVTKSGTNALHGNLYETWNGRAMNSTDYFVNANATAANPAQKPFSNVNEFGGRLGGPLKKDKLFFFTDYEATRIALPLVSHVTVPSANYENYVIQQLPLGGTDPIIGNTLPAEPGEVPFYQNMFKLYGNTAIGSPVAQQGCPLNADGSVIPAGGVPNGIGCANQGVITHSVHTRDTLFTLKMDYDRSQADQYWGRFENEQGTQATYTDPFQSQFSAISTQPQRTGDAGWTHIFSPSLVNQFNPGFTWYSAIFDLQHAAAAHASFPIVLGGGPFSNMGGINYVWPQGRNVMQWQMNDNLTWTRGAHTFKFGENTRRLDVSDHDFGIFNTPYVITCSLPEFTYGASCFTLQSFPHSLNEPVSLTNSDLFAMDTWKTTPSLTLTLGLRATVNTNPLSRQRLNARPASDFRTMSHDVNRPLSSDILVGQGPLFPSVPPVVWQPRGALAYQLRTNTLLKAGFGVFSDIFPASLTDSMATNPPYDPQFNAGFFGGAGGYAVAPGVPNSVVDAAVVANQQFQSAFSSGGISCSSPTAPANCIPQVNVTGLPNGRMQPPYFLQWSLALDHQFGTSWGLNAQYVGTRSIHIPYTESLDGFQTTCAGCFAPFPSAAPDARFGTFTQYQYGAYGSYHGLQITGQKRMSHGLQVQANYTWSHCLDTISNGGVFGYGGPNNFLSPLPGQLRRDYGNCDYDIRHSFNGSYVYQLPFHVQNAWLGRLANGWQVSGTMFHHTGLPFSVQSNIASGNLINTAGPSFANPVNGVSPYTKSNVTGVTQTGQVQWLNPNAFASVWDTNTSSCYSPALGNEAVDAAHCQFGTLARNSLRAPAFTWSDMFITKNTHITEKMVLRLEGQFYNVFNHPNFGFPSTTAGIPTTSNVPGALNTLTGFGTISNLVSPPTGLLGSFLGGDSAVRMIALNARLEF